MYQSRMLQRVFLTIVAASIALSAAVTQANNIPVVSMLSDLIADQGIIQNGDKTFSDFGYTWSGEMPPPHRVNVQAITDLEGNFGLRFSGPFTDSPVNGGSDALITYKVTAPSELIIGAHLAANLTGGLGSGFIGITESFNGATSSLQLDINPGQTVAWGEFDEPQMMIMVEKDIIAFATGANWPTMSFVDQTFAQIPEPTALLLAFAGCMGMLFRRPRRA